eukprot:scaffold276_cov116-Isochrysis_galbana.AAC.14
MAPRQLRLEPIEVDSAADKGAKRVRVDSTEESSTQQRPLRESQHPPLLPQLRLSTTTPSGETDLPIPTDYSTSSLLTTICTVPQMVPSSFDPFLPTAAELAGEDQEARAMDTSSSERQASTRCFRALHATYAMPKPEQLPITLH